jgi:hypothetical protein
MPVTEPIVLPPDNADRDTLLAFCKKYGVKHHWKHKASTLQLLIRTWAVENRVTGEQPKPQRPGILAQHRGNIDFIKRSEDPQLVEGRKRMLKSLLAANRMQTTVAYDLRVYIQALEKKLSQSQE